MNDKMLCMHVYLCIGGVRLGLLGLGYWVRVRVIIRIKIMT